ncbi:hypothetical protein OWM54_38930 [Myxococcus sp. MISCRS1]|uniref:hypothetical protein n=1 Tax=Myxococcus sp. MISCRS1 TaxID=2996786 RepID=UPI00226FBE3B|nr:hypothetical protein [Myxococcus sp. MISCRS1]MCY1003139.1 hypothetical protein [Myxococcus sp. MISCRS1]
MSSSPPLPPGAVAFVDRWRELFDARDWAALRAHEHPDFPKSGPPKQNDSFIRGLGTSGYRVASAKLKPFVQPKWSIFRTTRLHPQPTYWCDLVLKSDKGHQTEAFIALAPWEGTEGAFRASYYVELPPKKKVAPLDLGKEQARVSRFLAKAVKDFARSHKDPRPVQRLALRYSTENGALNVGFDLNPESEPGEGMTHDDFAELLVPRWPDVMEHKPALVGLDGVKLAAREDGTWGTPEAHARLEEHLGKMLVAMLLELRDSGQLEALRASDTAELGVEDSEGVFGWPDYEERGRENRLVAKR